MAQDNTPPTIGEHADIVLPATTAAGAVATYSVAVTDPDNTGTQLTNSCQPASGSTFPLGHQASTRTTIVTCDAQDPAGNHAPARTFTVTVRGARSQIISLENDVASTGTLTKHQEALLVSTLIHAERQLKAGATAGARSQLLAFVEQVRKLPRSHSQRRVIWITTATRIAAVTQ
jgi:hypothetical protein